MGLTSVTSDFITDPVVTDACFFGVVFVCFDKDPEVVAVFFVEFTTGTGDTVVVFFSSPRFLWLFDFFDFEAGLLQRKW